MGWLHHARDKSSPDNRSGDNPNSFPNITSVHCEILTWAGIAEPERKVLRTATELQQELAQLEDNDPWSGKSGLGLDLEKPKPLVILHGLPCSFLNVLVKDTLLHVDPCFIDAHSRRHRYKTSPPGPPSAATLVYPELVRIKDDDSLLQCLDEISGKIPPAAISSAEVDLLSAPFILHRLPPRIENNSDDTVAILLCRMSLWSGERADVLFLDRRIQDEPGVELRKITRGKSLIKPHSLQQRSTTAGNASFDVVLGEGEEKPYLDETLHKTLSVLRRDGGGPETHSLAHMLVDVVYDQWLDLFEDLRPVRLASHASEVLRALNGNLDVAREVFYRQQRQDTSIGQMINLGTRGFANWEILLRRLDLHLTIDAKSKQRPIRVLANIDGNLSDEGENDIGGDSKHMDREKRTQNLSHNADPNSFMPTFTYTSSFDSTTGPSNGSSARQSLHRLEILAGVLLPFSIASGMLSMDQAFAPGEELFWVFWVITVPLVGLTVLLIVVDKERLRPYYQLVSDSDVEKNPGDNGSFHGLNGDDFVVDLGRGANSEDHGIRGEDEKPDNNRISREGRRPPRPAPIEVPPAGGLALVSPPEHSPFTSFLHTPPPLSPASPAKSVLRRTNSQPAAPHMPEPDEDVIIVPGVSPLSSDSVRVAAKARPVEQQRMPSFSHGHRPGAATTGTKKTTRPLLRSDGRRSGRIFVEYDEAGYPARRWRRQQMGWGRAFASVLGLSKPSGFGGESPGPGGTYDRRRGRSREQKGKTRQV